jgi:RNA polymerase sigma factor (sigma-70 family)
VKSDATLIREAVKSPDAFRELYDRHVAELLSWLERRTGNPILAFELTAETFAEAALGLGRFEDRANGSAAPWLFGIAANLLRRYYVSRRVDTRARRRLGLPPAAVEAEYEEVEERDETERLSPALRSAVSNLPEGQQQALELRVVHELPYADVADALGCSPLAARLRVSRALGALAQSLKGAAR